MAPAWISLAVVWIAVFNSPVDSLLLQCTAATAWKTMLDAMQSMMTTNGTAFNATTYTLLNNVMLQTDKNLPSSHNAAWQGMINYWNGSAPTTDKWGNQIGFKESNVTTTNVINMPIFEPCNYAGSVAYYYSMIGIYQQQLSNSTKFRMKPIFLKSLRQAFSSLAFSSAFMHGSRTLLGTHLYQTSLSVIAYILHRAMLYPLPTNSSIIKDISLTPSVRNSTEQARTLQNLYLKQNVSNWNATTKAMKVTSYQNFFLAYLSTASSFTSANVSANVTAFAQSNKIDASVVTFLNSSYIPAIRKYTANITLSAADKTSLDNLQKTITTILQTLFVQTGRADISASGSFASEFGMELLLKKLNVTQSSSLFQIYNLNSTFQVTGGLFPGANWCLQKYPYSAQEVTMATALLNLVYLTDDVVSFLLKYYPH